MILSLQNYCNDLTKEFDMISSDRKILLGKIVDYILNKHGKAKSANLIYICTHNSRRSHFGQIWSKVASVYYDIKNVNTFSGGTQTTSFNIHAIDALKRIGFLVKKMDLDENPFYNVFYDALQEPIESFSKLYDYPENPQQEFAAIMTCAEAEENCPFIPGAEIRIATPYEDPKAFDGTSQQAQKYDERCKQIARESFYIFSLIQKSK